MLAVRVHILWPHNPIRPQDAQSAVTKMLSIFVQGCPLSAALPMRSRAVRGASLSGSQAALAQLVEHIIRNDGVRCSSHLSGTGKPRIATFPLLEQVSYR